MIYPSSTALTVEEVDPLTGDEWDEAVLSHPEATIFHESAWARVLAESYGHVPTYLKFSKDDELIALIPLMEVSSWIKGSRGVCLPFADSCAPLIFRDEETPEVLRMLGDISMKKEWKYVELRGMCGRGCVGISGSVPSFFGHELKLLEGEDAQFELLNSAARRSVRKSQGAGFSVSISQSWSSVQKFFSLHEKTRRKHGVPPQPISFFRNLQHSILEAGKGFVSLVERGGQPVAGAVFLRSPHRAIYKFGASDSHYLEGRPNHLAIWEGLRALVSQGCPVLDFGRTSCNQEGLRRFKRSWGAREMECVYLRSAVGTDSWAVKSDVKSSPLGSVFRFMPLPINRLAGKTLYPHLD